MTQVAAQPAMSKRRKSLWHKLLRNPVAVLPALLLGVAVILALAAPLLVPHNPDLPDLAHRLLPPGSPGYGLGTDSLGRDILSRVLYGARVSLAVGGAAVIGAGVIGVLAGLVSGYFGGVVDDVIMRIADVQLSVPFLLLALVVIAAVGPSLPNLVFILILRNWVTYARIVRSQVLELRTLTYVEAARAIGETDGRILVKHILPQVWGSVIAITSFTMAEAMIAEASLSFLGAGVQPPTATWGSMLKENLLYLATGWWTVVFPAIALTVVILSLNILGDWLRDALDPTLQR
ncbi:MAG: oligopeptide transporter permease [Firmicutes bacterium]|nr:oligopeptide transporter permease [Bacillota bacterium]